MNLELQMSAVEKISGSVPDIPIEYEQILKDRGGSWNDVNRSYLPEDSVLTAQREETAWALADGVHEIVPMQECVDRQETTLPFPGSTQTNMWILTKARFDGFFLPGTARP